MNIVINEQDHMVTKDHTVTEDHMVTENHTVTEDHMVTENDLFALEDHVQTAMQDQTAMELNYSLNYTLPMLRHIAGFYELDHKRMKKKLLIELIVQYELDQENIYIVQDRQRLWYYIDEIKDNKYLSKYLIIPSG